MNFNLDSIPPFLAIMFLFVVIQKAVNIEIQAISTVMEAYIKYLCPKSLVSEFAGSCLEGLHNRGAALIRCST